MKKTYKCQHGLGNLPSPKLFKINSVWIEKDHLHIEQYEQDGGQRNI